ncbi:hypothetical protein A2Y85_06350 [candidate division WOR-3 bacterium RBG_13_43_14]|uniref:Secretion system C-terminal sorting domain-containing protein n=1 Tax=candidate division WOR-3 bacterium RBG_13_43_14 TaxID=1802590 RepID=A0A1F4UCQ8_UNCW3|nr:MAG: hypothetical protein A2Y85_06350 [candidate division WOR-3 bacterium RBG_13_43_14]
MTLYNRIVSFLIISKTLILYAQVPDTVWTKTFDNNPFDRASSVLQTLDGGYIIFGETGTIEPTSTDAYIIKTDHLGDTLWTRIYDIDSVDCLSDGNQTFDGGYIGAGHISGQQNTSIFLMKTDQLGETLWTKIISEECICYSVIQASDSGYVLVGEWLALYPGLCLMKTDSDGNSIWDKRYDGTNDDFGWQVCQTSDGGYYVLGSTASFGSGSYDIWLLRTDADGDTLWTRTYGGTSIEYGGGLDITADGGCIIVGCTYSFGSGGGDIWLLRINNVGDTLWTKLFGGSSYDIGLCVRRTYEGGYIMTGLTESFGVDSSALWIIKTDANGTLLWGKLYDRPHIDYGNCVRQTSDSGYIVVGHTFPASLTNDIWLLKFATDTCAIFEEKLYIPMKRIHATIINESLLIPATSQFKIYDITGRMIEPDKITTGIYLLETEKQKTIKIIIIK